jgi:hypothetical protein
LDEPHHKVGPWLGDGILQGHEQYVDGCAHMQYLNKVGIDRETTCKIFWIKITMQMFKYHARKTADN